MNRLRASDPETCAWRHELRRAVRDPAELLALLELPEDLLPAARRAAESFPLRVPRGFLDRIRRGDPDDPLLRQILPLGAELDADAAALTDAVGDGAATLEPGLLQKYEGRILLVTTGACAVHCRYCFRRHFPYGDAGGFAQLAPRALRALADDPTLGEVLLSGGDPLFLPDEALAEFVARAAEIPHLHTLRLHTRLPIVLPERVDEELVRWSTRTRLRTVVVVHANHPAELDDRVAEALDCWRRGGALLLNQSVLLRGVNDDADTLVALSRRLIEIGVLPYYLHQLDRVTGTVHFAVAPERGRALLEELRARLPGYAVPRYVVEVPGAPSKLPV